MSSCKKNTIKVPRFKIENGFKTTEKRSKMMSCIKGKNTKPEMLLRKELWSRGLRYRVNNKDLPGKPDISIKKYKLAVFVDGEFWHGYNWSKKKMKIKSNRKFWIPKIERNMQRDEENNLKLKEKGYKVIRYWAKEVKDDVSACAEPIVEYLEKKKENS